jgi:hypothetical protein
MGVYCGVIVTHTERGRDVEHKRLKTAAQRRGKDDPSSTVLQGGCSTLCKILQTGRLIRTVQQSKSKKRRGVEGEKGHDRFLGTEDGGGGQPPQQQQWKHDLAAAPTTLAE